MAEHHDAMLVWLDAQGPAKAAEIIEQGIGSALEHHDVAAVPGLLVLMCRFGPHRADRLRQTMLVGCDLTEALRDEQFGQSGVFEPPNSANTGPNGGTDTPN